MDNGIASPEGGRLHMPIEHILLSATEKKAMLIINWC